MRSSSLEILKFQTLKITQTIPTGTMLISSRHLKARPNQKENYERKPYPFYKHKT